jgi:hypothetical protein
MSMRNAGGLVRVVESPVQEMLPMADMQSLAKGTFANMLLK